MRFFNTIAIVGVGLIGGSIGLRIKKKKLAKKIIGIGHHQNSINKALKLGAIDEGSLNINEIRNADLVILAVPVSAIIEFLPKTAKIVKKDCIVIDVGSTKSRIMACVDKLNIEFVGCHPLAGLEKRGVGSARSDLFEKSLCLMVNSNKASKKTLDSVKKFWNILGAKTKHLSASEHDRILAFVSHLPHALAFSLMDCIASKYLPFGAGGLKDTSRIALSDCGIWRDIFLSNKEEVLKAIARFKHSLSALESSIRRSQSKKLELYLRKSREKRNEL